MIRHARLAVIASLALGLASVPALLDARGRAGDDPRALVQENWDELHRALGGMSFEREAPWGETRDDLAWSHYAAAFARMDRRGAEFVRPLERATATDGESRQLAPELLDGFGDVLDMVRRGARSRDARPMLRWQDGAAMRVPKGTEVRACAQLALLEVLVSVTPAEELDAVRSILDVQQLACDLAATPIWHCENVGLQNVVPEILEAHLDAGLLDRLGEGSRREWLQGLDRIDATLAGAGPPLLDELISAEIFAWEKKQRGRSRQRAEVRDRLARLRHELESSL